MENILFTYAVVALVVLAYVTCVFIIAQARKDNSIMDVFYGPAFALSAWISLWLLEAYSIPAIILNSLITLWALRLSIRIALKNWGRPEDQRYAAWREEWTKRSQIYFILRSYIQINLLQGVIITIVALPMILMIAARPEIMSPLSYIGAAILLFGLMYGTTADWQLDRFIARKKAGTETANLMTTGLFTYSRRPNYFGESLIWWGATLFALPYEYGYIAFLSPLLITFILAWVTGPMLERIFRQKYGDEYRRYSERTNYFVPGFPKQSIEKTE